MSGKLRHNLQGRYEIPGETYFTCGDPIEIFYDDEWLKGSIEYSHKLKDYYFLIEDEQIYIYDLENVLAKSVE